MALRPEVERCLRVQVGWWANGQTSGGVSLKAKCELCGERAGWKAREEEETKREGSEEDGDGGRYVRSGFWVRTNEAPDLPLGVGVCMYVPCSDSSRQQGKKRGWMDG